MSNNDKVNNVYTPVTECPSCRYSPIHCKLIDFDNHVQRMYKCSLCGYESIATHVKRE